MKKKKEDERCCGNCGNSISVTRTVCNRICSSTQSSNTPRLRKWEPLPVGFVRPPIDMEIEINE